MKLEYMRLDQFAACWWFEDPAIAVSEDDRLLIKPLTPQSGAIVWKHFISQQNRHPMTLGPEEWPCRSDTWSKTGEWHNSWNSCSPELPALLESDISWPENTSLFFAWCRELVVETTWGIFKKYWKCFLFDDEGPFLFSPDRPEVVSFGPAGNFRIGKRSQVGN